MVGASSFLFLFGHPPHGALAEAKFRAEHRGLMGLLPEIGSLQTVSGGVLEALAHRHGGHRPQASSLDFGPFERRVAPSSVRKVPSVIRSSVVSISGEFGQPSTAPYASDLGESPSREPTGPTERR